MNTCVTLWREDVRRRLLKADWVSLKVDAVDQTTWRRIDRPHKALRMNTMLGGIRGFAKEYAGTPTTESMLVADVNDHETSVASVAAFLAELAPSKAYLAVPIRPTASPTSQPATEEVINRGFQIMAHRLPHVELLTGYEGNAFASKQRQVRRGPAEHYRRARHAPECGGGTGTAGRRGLERGGSADRRGPAERDGISGTIVLSA